MAFFALCCSLCPCHSCLPAWSAPTVFSSNQHQHQQQSRAAGSKAPDCSKARSRTQSAGAAYLDLAPLAGCHQVPSGKEIDPAVPPKGGCPGTSDLLQGRNHGWACGSSGPMAAEIEMRVGIAPVSIEKLGIVAVSVYSPNGFKIQLQSACSLLLGVMICMWPRTVFSSIFFTLHRLAVFDVGEQTMAHGPTHLLCMIDSVLCSTAGYIEDCRLSSKIRG